MDQANVDQLGISHPGKLRKMDYTELQKSLEIKRNETPMDLKDFKYGFNQLDSLINVTGGKDTNR